MIKLLRICALLVCALASTAVSIAQQPTQLPTQPAQQPAQNPEPHAEWTQRTIELAGSLTVQDGGRLKPLSTFASFTLLRINGRRSYTDSGGARRTAVEFVLDTIYAPDRAADARVFLVNDSAVVQAIGLELPDKHKRDRYTFHELEPGIGQLFALAHAYDRIDAKQRSSVQGEIVLLAERVDAFLALNRLESLALIPPEDGAQGDSASVWLTPARMHAVMHGGETPSATRTRVLTALNDLASARGDASAFDARLGELHAALDAFPAVRAAASVVALERRYYALDPLGWGLIAFVLAFLAAAVGWLRPQWNWLHKTSIALTSLGALALIVAIVMRCTIRGRPPVSTLYETVLFVSAVGTCVALVLEWFDRQRVASSVAAFAGMVGLFIANGYETLDAKDTMPSLVAVLDTNFWLSTHVTAITVGYSAGLLAALLGTVYVLAKVIRPVRMTPEMFHALGRKVYGVLCFGLIFSTVGTILGGIWANESWGRFWGWDPKENGALLIVITQLVILHARMGGYLREFGVAIAAAAAGTVVAFSWWGVNLLGVGLHSYGFTSGIQSALSSYYVVQGSVVALGVWAAWRERRSRSRSSSESVSARAGASRPSDRRRAA